MKHSWFALGIAGVLAGGPLAFAHELECEKTVNGKTYLELSEDDFPAELTYSLTVRNIHPTLPSDVLEATDPFLEGLGFAGFATPFTLALGAEETKTFTVTVESLGECEALAKQDRKDDSIIENVFKVRWDTNTDHCAAKVVCVPTPPTPPPTDGGQPPTDGGQPPTDGGQPPTDGGQPPEVKGRMTGGGSVFVGDMRVTHGFQLRCDASDPRQNLEINWQGNRFHLLDLTSATCTDNPAIDEGQPVAGFDTFTGEGTGRYNGVPGYTIEFTFTDAGEPGVNDTAEITITGPGGDVLVVPTNELTFGNHQAHDP